jgi:hypothetical protein
VIEDRFDAAAEWAEFGGCGYAAALAEAGAAGNEAGPLRTNQCWDGPQWLEEKAPAGVEQETR